MSNSESKHQMKLLYSSQKQAWIFLFWIEPQYFTIQRCLDLFVDVYVSFRFKAKEDLQRCGDVFDILITSKGASALVMF